MTATLRVLAALLALVLATSAPARADTPEVPEALRPAVEALEAGDAAWFAGRRGRGARHWRRALRRADGEHPLARSVRIRARVRLLRAGTNWTPLMRIPGMNRDVEACPAEDPWCQLAFVDIYLLAPSPLLGQDLAVAARGLDGLAGTFPEAVAARRTLLLGAPPPPLSDEALGLTRAVHAPPPDTLQPGTRVVAPGLLADPALGVGLTLRLLDPDLARRRWLLDLNAGVAVHGGFGVLTLATPQGEGPWRGLLQATGLRSRWWDGEAWAPVVAGRIEAGPRWSKDGWWWQVRPRVRWDADVGAPTRPRAGHEGWAEVGLDRRSPIDGDPRRLKGGMISLSAEGTVPGVAAYDRVGGTLEGRLSTGLGDGVLASRARVQATWGPDQPTSRIPWLGGPSLLRGAPFGGLDGDVVGLLSGEVRHPIWRVLWAAAFVDVGATPEGPVPGGGAGLRMVPPPGLGDVVRIDVGVSPLGFQLQVGLGEAF